MIIIIKPNSSPKIMSRAFLPTQRRKRNGFNRHCRIARPPSKQTQSNLLQKKSSSLHNLVCLSDRSSVLGIRNQELRNIPTLAQNINCPDSFMPKLRAFWSLFKAMLCSFTRYRLKYIQKQSLENDNYRAVKLQISYQDVR